MSVKADQNVLDARYSAHSLELGLRILEGFDRDAVEAKWPGSRWAAKVL